MKKQLSDDFRAENLRPSPSPWKAKFRDYGVTVTELSYACGLSIGYLSQILNGWRPMPDDLEARLRALEFGIELDTDSGVRE